MIGLPCSLRIRLQNQNVFSIALSRVRDSRKSGEPAGRSGSRLRKPHGGACGSSLWLMIIISDTIRIKKPSSIVAWHGFQSLEGGEHVEHGMSNGGKRIKRRDQHRRLRGSSLRAYSARGGSADFNDVIFPWCSNGGEIMNKGFAVTI